MLDHVFLTVSNMKRSISFYEAALAPLGIKERFDFDAKNGPPGHPDLKGFGANGRLFLWLREGIADSYAAHIGFIAKSRKQVVAAYDAAITAGATDNGAPASDSTMALATMLLTCWTLTGTASNSFTRVGSTHKKNKATQGQLY